MGMADGTVVIAIRPPFLVEYDRNCLDSPYIIRYNKKVEIPINSEVYL